jgi:radical SAM protein with 4Fe4S-binding SPASM domain
MDQEIPIPTELISQIHLLDQCNLRCTHCYVGDSRFKPREMPSLETIKKRIKTICDFSRGQGFKDHTMNISGGEPTLREDLLEIISCIRENGAVPMLLTNGMRMTEGFARKVKEAGCNHLQVSIEGLGEYNDSIRGEGTYEKALQAVRNARAAGLTVVIGTTLSGGNIGHIKEFFHRLDGEADKFHVREVTGIGAGADLDLLSREERRDFYEFAYNWKGKTRLFVEDPPYCSIAEDLVDKRAGCAAFICLLCVDVDGSVYPCRKAPVKMGHIDDLEAAWNSPTAIRLRNRDFEGKCGTCDIKWSCGGCRGNAAAKGDILGSDDRCFH